MIRDLVRSLVREPVRSPMERRGGFSPTRLFAAGEQGFWYDPQDLSTQYQDSAGTTPVTAVGQAVGRVLDKSGRGNHLIQATGGSRPILRQDASGFYYWEFDGLDDSWQSAAAINFSATDKLSLFAGVRKLDDSAVGVIAEFSDNLSTNNGTFQLLAPAGATPSYGFRSKGTISAPADAASGYAAPLSNVLAGLGDIGADSSILRVNGIAAATSVSDQGTGNYGAFVLNVGRRNNSSLPLYGRQYHLIGVGKAVDAATLAQVERFVGARMGIAL